MQRLISRLPTIDVDAIVKRLGEVVVLLDDVLADVSLVVKTDGSLPLVSNGVKLTVDVVAKIIFDVLAVSLSIHVFYCVPDGCLLF